MGFRTQFSRLARPQTAARRLNSFPFRKMKRLAVSVVLLLSSFACSGSPEAEGPALAPSATAIEVGSQPASEVIELSEDQSDAADDLATTVPTGAFADVDAFCAAQTKLVAPKVAEANAAFKMDGYGDMKLAPKCAETPKVLEGANVALALPYTDVKAVSFETGYSIESYLLVHRAEGWTAVRSAVIYVNHNDPGCGSIERPGDVLDVHVEKGAIVVKSTAGRTWMNQKNELGELTLTYARACRPSAAAIACGTPEVVDANVVLQDEENSDAPTATRFFTTTYNVGTGVAIEPATRFNEDEL